MCLVEDVDFHLWPELLPPRIILTDANFGAEKTRSRPGPPFFFFFCTFAYPMERIDFCWAPRAPAWMKLPHIPLQCGSAGQSGGPTSAGTHTRVYKPMSLGQTSITC